MHIKFWVIDQNQKFFFVLKFFLFNFSQKFSWSSIRPPTIRYCLWYITQFGLLLLNHPIVQTHFYKQILIVKYLYFFADSNSLKKYSLSQKNNAVMKFPPMHNNVHIITGKKHSKIYLYLEMNNLEVLTTYKRQTV